MMRGAKKGGALTCNTLISRKAGSMQEGGVRGQVESGRTRRTNRSHMIKTQGDDDVKEIWRKY